MSDFLIKAKKLEENKFLEEQTQQWQNEYNVYEKTMGDSTLYEKRHYAFLTREENRMNWHFGSGSEITKEAEPAVDEKLDFEFVQNQRELSKAEKNVVAQESKLLEKQKALSDLREATSGITDRKLAKKAAKKQAKLEKSYLDDKLELINLQAEADMEKAKGEKEKLEINMNKNKAIVDAWTDYVKTLEIGTSAREKAIKSKENAQLDLYWATYKVKLEETEPAQQKKARAKYKRKVAEAWTKAVISKNDENCNEDHIIETSINGQPVQLINMGRAFLGGTKPTYYYKDMKSGKMYLYKKAENCCGVQKPEGAIVTEIGAKIQHIVDEEHEIPAVGIKNSKGKYIGSVQEIVDLNQNPTLDFDKWQLTSTENGGQDPKVVQNPEIQKQLLIFHCVDWLLCNFDTKGEHLLQLKNGQFVSIDKEGGMNQILKDGSQKMSCTYKTHNHEPIYNVFYRMIQSGEITLDEGALKALDDKVKLVENTKDEEYIAMFEPYIKQVNKKPAQMKENILKRKRELRDEYNRFLDTLKKGLKLPDTKD